MGGKSGQPLEKPQQFPLPGELHELEDDLYPRVVIFGGGIEASEIEQRVGEFR